MWAASRGHVEVLSMLKSAGADLGVKGAGGWTAVMVAAAEGHVAAAKFLLRRE
jgi:ankyrin repeat protein